MLRCPLSARLPLNFELLAAAAIFKLVFWFPTSPPTPRTISSPSLPTLMRAAARSLVRSVPFRRSVSRVPVWKGSRALWGLPAAAAGGGIWRGGSTVRGRFRHAVCWFLWAGSCWFLGPMRYNFMLLRSCCTALACFLLLSMLLLLLWLKFKMCLHMLERERQWEGTVAGNVHANKLTIARPIFQPFPLSRPACIYWLVN